MDPFSIVVGSVALVETANTVATVLIDTYRSYTNAPAEMVEIADQLTTCSGLVDIFANSIKGTMLPRDFHYVAQNLVDQCQQIFKEVNDMLADPNRLKYAFGKKKQIQKRQKDLKRLQHMFMFLTTCYIYHPSQRGDLGQPDLNSLQGTLQNVPVQISMPNTNGRSTLLYEATLTLKPTQSAASSRMSSRPADGDSKLGKHSLNNMRRSPYFWDSFLQPPQRKQAKYESEYARKEDSDESEIISIPSREEASRDVEKLLSRWFVTSSPGPSSPRPSARRPAVPRAPEPPSHIHESEEEDFDHIHVPYPEEDSFPPLRHTVSPRGDPPPQTYPLRPAGTRPSVGPRVGSSTSSTAYSGGAEGVRGGLKGRGRKRSWDWSCDGCDGKFIYDDGNKQFQCMRCHDPFDFCEECLDHGDHLHGRRDFAEVRGS